MVEKAPDDGDRLVFELNVRNVAIAFSEDPEQRLVICNEAVATRLGHTNLSLSQLSGFSKELSDAWKTALDQQDDTIIDPMVILAQEFQKLLSEHGYSGDKNG